jgi:hypothetical protein
MINLQNPHDVCGSLRRRNVCMTVWDFQLLPQQKQVEILYRDGVYIGKHKAASSIILLFQLDSFYVEVFYRKYRSHIKLLHCFDSTEHLDPYLEQIDVEDLV